jgi:hypothetical protein
MTARQILVTFALLLLTAELMVSAASAVPQCSQKVCREEIQACEGAAACDDLSSKAKQACRVQCVRQVLAACEADSTFCSPTCGASPVPQCGGSCPRGDTCVDSGGVCDCIPFKCPSSTCACVLVSAPRCDPSCPDPFFCFSCPPFPDIKACVLSGLCGSQDDCPSGSVCTDASLCFP